MVSTPFVESFFSHLDSLLAHACKRAVENLIPRLAFRPVPARVEGQYSLILNRLLNGVLRSPETPLGQEHGI